MVTQDDPRDIAAEARRHREAAMDPCLECLRDGEAPPIRWATWALAAALACVAALTLAL